MKKFVRKILKIVNGPTSDDGRAVSTGNNNVSEYKSAPSRMKDSQLDLPEMNPFTFDKDRPALVCDSVSLTWDYIEKINGEFVGLTVLKDNRQNILLALKYAVYLHLLDSGRTFLIYQHDDEIQDSKQFLSIHLIKTNNLKPLTEKQIISFAEEKDTKFLYEAISLIAKIELKPDQLKFKFPFTGEFKTIPEFFVVRNVEWIERKSYGRTAIISIRPSEETIEIHPQDWFNNSDTIDFGYQWITMAARDSKTGKIHGFGIRLTNFVLDASGRELDRGGDTSFF